jgi:tetratricopeptide (TPR) repeat protein
VSFSGNFVFSRIFAFPLAAALFSLVVFTACGHENSGSPPHYAFTSFENLSGDPSLDWVSEGASEFLSRSLREALNPGNVLSPDAIARTSQTLGGRPSKVPGISAARSGAMIAGANRIVEGYIERSPAGVRITATEENLATHKTERTLSATAAYPFAALNLLAHELSAKAGPPATSNAEALRLYSMALEVPASDATPLLERAVALDPSFGRAWVTLARTYAALGDRGRTSEVIDRARAQNKIAPMDRAWIDFEAAALGGDQSAKLAAMRKVSEFDAGDAELARTLAEAETSAGNFSQAAAVWKKLTASMPGDANAWNQLGYTLCWSGDYAGALGALRDYARLRPNEANPLDSQGDVHYWFGKFGDASASYSAAYAKMPDFLNGGELYKIAWAKFRAGDKSADSSFAKFREAREKARDQSIDLFAGDWLYRTGRGKEAVAMLRDAAKKETAETTAALRSGIAAQLTIWDLLARDRETAAKDIASGGSTDITPSSLMARFAALPTASASDWEVRATRMLASPQLVSLRSLALGYALILDRKKQAAIPVWEQIVKQSPGNDFFARAILAKLTGQPEAHDSPPDAINFNPFASIGAQL